MNFILTGGLPESETTFQTQLLVVDNVGDNVACTNQIKFSWLPVGFDTTRHYTAKIHCDTNYTPSKVKFDKTVNIRDVIANDSGYVNLPGITNVPNGTVYGTIDVNCPFNRVVFDKIGGNTNVFRGNTIVNYDSSMQINFPTNIGYKISNYIVTRTDNTGTVSVVTNDISSQNVSSTNIVLNNIKGSNSVYATYSPFTFSFNVVSANGGEYPGTTNNVPYGTTLEQKITNSPVSLGAGSRAVANGGTVTGNAYTQNNPTNITINSPGLTNNATLTWNWKTQEMFNASSTGNGIVTGEGNGWKDYGSNISVTASPANEDYAFANWSGDTNSTANPLNFAVNKPYTNLTANFSEKTTTNGIPFTWFTQYGLTNKTESGEIEDKDNDGMNNLKEYISDTNPTNPASYFQIGDLKQGNSMDLTIPQSSTGRIYYVDASTNLLEGEAGWTKGITNSYGNGSNLVFELDANGDNKGFYRARVEKE